MKKVIIVFSKKEYKRQVKKHKASKKQDSVRIILLAMPLPIHTVTATLDMPTGNAARGDRTKEVTDACAVSPLVIVDPAVITAVRATITDYGNATPSTRVNLYRLMHNGLKGLMGLFQAAANADPANAIAIIQSGKFGVKQVAIQQKHVFNAENNPVSGRIDLTAPGGPKRCCHDWKYSADGVNFVRMQPTLDAHTFKDGLTPRTFAYFTHELITKDGPQGISQIIKIEVK